MESTFNPYQLVRFSLNSSILLEEALQALTYSGALYLTKIHSLIGFYKALLLSSSCLQDSLVFSTHKNRITHSHRGCKIQRSSWICMHKGLRFSQKFRHNEVLIIIFIQYFDTRLPVGDHIDHSVVCIKLRDFGCD